MTKTTLVLIVFFTSFTLTSKAQEYSLGGGLGYGSGINTIGINFRGDAKFNKLWSISPHFNFFFNKKNDNVSKKWNAFNVDGHYFFEIDPTWVFYPLFGVNIATVSEKVNGVTFSNSAVGINLGFGTEYSIDSKLTGFGEVKYVIGDADQLVMFFGILYML